MNDKILIFRRNKSQDDREVAVPFHAIVSIDIHPDYDQYRVHLIDRTSFYIDADEYKALIGVCGIDIRAHIPVKPVTKNRKVRT